ncbi:MAG: RNA polymerase sigma factor [Actinobacteria bacterium]|nr:RNA polymerase sigma factor [Actinomycetota bacterium]
MRAHDEFLAATLPAMDLVYNLARRLAWGPRDAEDLVQETYLRAFAAWTSGRRPRRVEPWIATICLNAGRSWLRRSSTRLEEPSEALTDWASPDDTEGEAIRSLRRDRLHEALWQLPEEQRVAIALMDLTGLTAAETARITGSPRGTVLARVHRGRKRLAAILEREGVTWP